MTGKGQDFSGRNFILSSQYIPRDFLRRRSAVMVPSAAFASATIPPPQGPLKLFGAAPFFLRVGVS
jgi:hypothetical protein